MQHMKSYSLLLLKHFDENFGILYVLINLKIICMKAEKPFVVFDSINSLEKR